MRLARLKGIIIGLLLGIITPVIAEEITLVTYYPAPRGVYEELRTTGTTALATQSGSVGIGTTAPSNLLHVSQNPASTNTVLNAARYERLTTGTAAAGLGVAQDFYLEDAAGNSNQAARIDVVWEDATNASEDASIRFNQMRAGALTEVMRIGANGFVGINTTASDSALEVFASDTVSNTVLDGLDFARINTAGPGANGIGARITLQAENTASGVNDAVHLVGLLTDATAATVTSAFTLATRTGGGAMTERLRVTGTGNVGIGDTTPDAMLEANNGTSTSSIFIASDNDTPVMTVADGGATTFTNTVVSSRITDLGWSVFNTANQACNTTCTSACVFGMNTDVTPPVFVACTSALADACVCAGPS